MRCATYACRKRLPATSARRFGTELLGPPQIEDDRLDENGARVPIGTSTTVCPRCFRENLRTQGDGKLRRIVADLRRVDRVARRRRRRAAK